MTETCWFPRYLIEKDISKIFYCDFRRILGIFGRLAIDTMIQYHEQTQLLGVIHILSRCSWCKKSTVGSFGRFWLLYYCRRWYLPLPNASIFTFSRFAFVALFLRFLSNFLYCVEMQHDFFQQGFKSFFKVLQLWWELIFRAFNMRRIRI